MKAHGTGFSMATAVILIAVPVGAQESQAPYKFTKGDVLKYAVAGNLEISLNGSHPAFIPGGIVVPLKMAYTALFENVVVEVAESDGSARMERRVRTLSAKGEFQGAAFKFDWDREKDKGKPAGPGEEPGTIAGLFRTWCTDPLPFTVAAGGKFDSAVPNYDQLVNRAGVMFWPVKPDSKSWVTEEKLAAPLLHNKIIIEFKNEFGKTVNRDNRKLMIISATPTFKRSEEPPEGIPPVVPGPIDFKVTGTGNQIEIDATNRRLHSVKLNLTIKLSGKGPVGGGVDGDFRGEVTFTESQVYKD